MGPATVLCGALLACRSSPDDAVSARRSTSETPHARAEASPARPSDPGAFTPERYHERAWDAVRVRALTHLSAQGRDRARARAMAGDYAGCAAQYTRSADELAATPLGEPISMRIRDAHVGGLRRDAALCAALARGDAPPVPATPVAALYATAARARVGRVVPALTAPPVPVLPLVLPDRHAQRAALTEAWVDTVDPLAPTDPWGYWTPDEALRAHARASGHALPATPFVVTAEDLAAPPTGDTYVDSAGLPGPRAVAPPGNADTSAEGALAGALLDAGTAGAVAALERGIDSIARKPDGDRRARGAEAAVLRALARAGAYGEAARIARAWRSERGFEQATINRQGVVRGIEGRLLLLAGDPSADATLAEAEDQTRAFLRTLAGIRAAGGAPDTLQRHPAYATDEKSP